MSLEAFLRSVEKAKGTIVAAGVIKPSPPQQQEDPMSYGIDDPTGRVVAEWRGSSEPPRFTVGDLVVEIVSNELYQVADRYCAQLDLVDTWIYVCQKMKIDDEAGRILRTTHCDADLEEIPDAELQPRPPQRLPEEPKSLPPAPPRTAVPQTLVLRSFLPPQQKPALTGPQGALQPPRRLRPQGLLLSKKGGGS